VSVIAAPEPISPELVLVSPDLRQRLQALGAIDGTPRWLRPNQREGVAAEAFAAYSIAQGVELADRWRSLAPAAAAALVGLLGGTLALAPTNGQPSRVVPILV
jgi:hypothetical protein